MKVLFEFCLTILTGRTYTVILWCYSTFIMGEHFGIVAGIYRRLPFISPTHSIRMLKEFQYPKVAMKFGGVLLIPVSADAVYTLPYLQDCFDNSIADMRNITLT